MKKAVPVIIAVALIFVIVAITFGGKGWRSIFPIPEERMDLNGYFGLEAADEAALVLNDEIREEKGIVRDGRCYLDLGHGARLPERPVLRGLQRRAGCCIPRRTRSCTRRAGETGPDGYVPAFLEDGVMYAALDYVKKYTNFSYTLVYGAEPGGADHGLGRAPGGGYERRIRRSAIRAGSRAIS